MNKGEKEIEELSIENTAGFKNLIAIRDFSVKTRKMFRKLEEERVHLQGQVSQLTAEIEQLRKQLQQLQVRTYSQNKTK